MNDRKKFRARLVRWGESSSTGRTVTFRLPDDTEEHPFKGLEVGSKKGQLVEIEVEIIDDDLPLETLDPAEKPKPKIGPKVGPKVRVIDETPKETGGGTPAKAPRAHFVDARKAKSGTPGGGAVSGSGGGSGSGSGNSAGTGKAPAKSTSVGNGVGNGARAFAPQTAPVGQSGAPTATPAGPAVPASPPAAAAVPSSAPMQTSAPSTPTTTPAPASATSMTSPSASPSPSTDAQTSAPAAATTSPSVDANTPTTSPAPSAAQDAPSQAQAQAPSPAQESAQPTPQPTMTPETLEHMAQAAEALANAAGRMGAEEEEEPDHHQARARQQNQGSGRGDEDEKKLPPGEKAVRRAVDLCTSIDKKRAGFFYYMRALYPSVPPGKNDGTTWSRDARATRDRVCFHCEADEIAGLADDEDARKKFEELEHAFERHERLR